MKKNYEDLEEENKNLKEKLSEITMVADDEKQSIEHILELEEENKKLKEELEDKQKVIQYYRKEKQRLTGELTKLKEKYGDLDS